MNDEAEMQNKNNQMKARHKIEFRKKPQIIIATISVIPGDQDEEFGDAEGQEINKDPIIGGADDVYRENPTDDLRDSDLVDAEPLQEDTNYTADTDEQTDKNQETEEFDTPSDSEEENLNISNLEDNEDITGGD